MRVGEVSRKTSETDVSVKVNLDGQGVAEVETGIEFLDHMLKSLATHSLIDITVKAKGDLTHHTLEDVAICLGEADSEGFRLRIWDNEVWVCDCAYGLFPSVGSC